MPISTNPYATDGKCHNANRGSYGHECGRPATWIGTERSGLRSGFCDRCKDIGDEAAVVVTWERRDAASDCWLTMEPRRMGVA